MSKITWKRAEKGQVVKMTHKVTSHESRNARKFCHQQLRQGHQDDNSESIYSNSDDISIDEDIAWIIQHIDVNHTAQHNAKKKNCKISRHGAKVQVKPDTGADANVMDE